MTLMIGSLNENLETFFLLPCQENIYLSSRIVKEVARLDGEIDQFVPACVKADLCHKLEEAEK